MMAWKSVIFIAGMAINVQIALAAVTPQEAEQLGTTLTPIGAERAGNAAGTIPAWDGGLTAPPPGIGYEQGKHHADPYAADKVLYTVRADNMAQYESQLTEAHKELLKAYPDSYFMNVYPTHRSCAYPQHVYDAVKRNAVSGQLTNDGNGFTGAVMAYPFPIPHTAREVLWNHEIRYQGFKVTRESANAAPTKSGDYTLDVALDQWIYRYSDPELKSTEDLDNVIMHFLKRGISPSNNAGTLSVTHNTLDHVRELRRGWSYRPGERKVKQVVGQVYDNTIASSDGIRINDTFNIFSGGGDRYDWELIGKQEKLIPYNVFRFASPEVKYKDILHKSHLNPEPMRYELHRVWVIEGKLKPGKSHKFASRRIIYFDEDSWAGAAGILYGADGGVARVQEAHIFNYYDQPFCNIGSDVVYDLAGGRYHIVNLRNEQKPVQFDIQDLPEAFSPEGMRRLGVR
jgi:Protein of unknown function (DUF1329)